jgi:hypothetical protein
MSSCGLDVLLSLAATGCPKASSVPAIQAAIEPDSRQKMLQ